MAAQNTVLSSEDLNALQQRQSLINIKRFEIGELELAFNFVRGEILKKYGLDPNGRYNMDERGIIYPLESAPQETPSPEQPPSN